MATSNGNCFICGKTTSKAAIKNHVLKEHNTGNEPCYLIKAEGAYDKNMWLFFTVALDASMLAVDKFFRQIWCECCGHLSKFYTYGGEFSKSRKVSSLQVGNNLEYEYDFGTTTEIVISVIDEILRPKQKEKVQLLARNVLPEKLCDSCGAPATVINAWENEMLCDECAEEVEDEAALLPLVNSPRAGECGYAGEQDIWNFDPSKPFPQPQKAKVRRGVWVIPESNNGFVNNP